MTNDLPTGWQEVQLDKITYFVNDKVSMSMLSLENYISTDNMNNNFGGVSIATKLPDVKSATAFKKGDILFSNIRTYFRKVWQAEFDGGCSADVLVFRSKDIKKLPNDYLYRLLTYNNFTDYTVATSKGAKMPREDKVAILNYKTVIPNINTECQNIADVLSSLDDKIENCRKINTTLENMAGAMFKSWFVDFEPVRALAEFENGKSQYKTKAEIAKSLYMSEQTLNQFPNKFNENKLPMGWEEKPLDKIANFLNGLALQKYPTENEKEFLPVIKIAELRNGITQKTNKASISIPKKYVIKNGDLIFSWSATLIQKIWSNGDGALNQHLFKVTSENYDKWFCYMCINTHLPEFRVIASSKTTTMGHIQRKHLTQTKIIIPNENILKLGKNTIGNMLDLIYKNELEIQTLTKIRDTLLPQLITGKIRV